jgi:hypothetical protein
MPDGEWIGRLGDLLREGEWATYSTLSELVYGDQLGRQAIARTPVAPPKDACPPTTGGRLPRCSNAPSKSSNRRLAEAGVAGASALPRQSAGSRRVSSWRAAPSTATPSASRGLRDNGCSAPTSGACLNSPFPTTAHSPTAPGHQTREPGRPASRTRRVLATPASPLTSTPQAPRRDRSSARSKFGGPPGDRLAEGLAVQPCRPPNRGRRACLRTQIRCEAPLTATAMQPRQRSRRRAPISRVHQVREQDSQRRGAVGRPGGPVAPGFFGPDTKDYVRNNRGPRADRSAQGRRRDSRHAARCTAVPRAVGVRARSLSCIVGDWSGDDRRRSNPCGRSRGVRRERTTAIRPLRSSVPRPTTRSLPAAALRCLLRGTRSAQSHGRQHRADSLLPSHRRSSRVATVMTHRSPASTPEGCVSGLACGSDLRGWFLEGVGDRLVEGQRAAFASRGVPCFSPAPRAGGVEEGRVEPCLDHVKRLAVAMRR